MTVTSKGFKGEERQFQPDDQYGIKGDSTEALLSQLAAQQNASASKGEQESYDAGDGSGNDAPRRHGTAQPQAAGNSASTGKAGPLPAGAANRPGPSTTGAGSGSVTVKKYGK